MCQSVFDIDNKVRIGTAREFANYLGIKPEELITFDSEPMQEVGNGDWRDSCLCPFDVALNLDASKIWHRRDDHDSMMTLATRLHR